jgi:membrane protease YdiL (CAAX protease family)
VAAAVLVTWIVLYRGADPSTHWGSFFGNAIADWSGVLVTVVATKYFYERGSAESKPVPRKWTRKIPRLVEAHSLTLVLLVTGIGWLVAFTRMKPGSKWGQVVGNVLSEWVQLLGVVLLTKRFFERGSAETARRK